VGDESALSLCLGAPWHSKNEALMLDVLVDPDRTWRWKDEDELQTFVDRGVFDAATAERAREEGRRVAAQAERNEPPFSDPWIEWRPDPAWEIPVLRDGWDRRCR
jgi:hypothetical protein